MQPLQLDIWQSWAAGQLYGAAAQTAAEAAHAGQNGAHLSIFLDETALPRSFQRAAHFSCRFH
jgi:hypothetical protein